MDGGARAATKGSGADGSEGAWFPGKLLGRGVRKALAPVPQKRESVQVRLAEPEFVCRESDSLASTEPGGRRPGHRAADAHAGGHKGGEPLQPFFRDHPRGVGGWVGGWVVPGHSIALQEHS
jgi:hypothetical protein